MNWTMKGVMMSIFLDEDAQEVNLYTKHVKVLVTRPDFISSATSALVIRTRTGNWTLPGFSIKEGSSVKEVKKQATKFLEKYINIVVKKDELELAGKIQQGKDLFTLLTLRYKNSDRVASVMETGDKFQRPLIMEVRWIKSAIDLEALDFQHKENNVKNLLADAVTGRSHES